MPYLNTNDLIQSRLFPAVGEGNHWAFLSDCERGFDALAQLIMPLAILGHEPDFGTVPFVNTSTGHQATIHFVVVAKTVMSREAVHGFLRLTGWYTRDIPQHKDIITLSEGDGMAVALFVYAIEQGKIHVAPPVEVN